MMGAMRVSGRWVDQQILERLSRRSRGPEPPSRRQLIEEFCRATDWRDAKKRLCLSSASVALRRLEQQGRVQLPPLAPRGQRTGARGLTDDGQPLPALPQLPGHGGAIPGLRLRLIVDADDPAHGTWNRRSCGNIRWAAGLWGGATALSGGV